MLRLRALDLTNFYGFESLSLPFEPDVTLLVGANGSGKTSILDAIRKCVYAARGTEPTIDGTVRRAGSRYCAATLTCEDASGRQQSVSVKSGLDHRPPPIDPRDLPVLAYGVERHAMDRTPGSTNAREYGVEAALEQWHDAPHAYETFFRWFREMEDLENERFREGDRTEHAGLAAVRRAVTRLLPDYTNLKVRRRFPPYTERPGLTLTRSGQELPFSILSEGERATVVLVADLARRLSLLTPDGDPLQGEAIVLVDEIDLHAHPAWQRRLVEGLRRVFPNVQWVWTTHSPIVVQECEPRSLRILKDFRLVEPTISPGADANAVLEDVFDQPPRRADVQRALDEVRSTLDDRDYGAAGSAVDRLAELTADGPDAVYYRTLLRRIIEAAS